MAKKKTAREDICPISLSLDVFGDRWTLLVLRDVLLESRFSYKHILAANPGLATNVLAERLKRLEARGLLTKQKDSQDARQFVYKPTEQAIRVIPMLVEMIVWGSKQSDTVPDVAFIERFEADRDKLINELETQASKNAVLS